MTHRLNLLWTPSAIRSAVPFALAASLMVLFAVLFAAPAFAQRDRTVQALDRMEETLQPMIDEGELAPQGIGPLLLVGATPAFEETRAWFPAASLQALGRVFGNGNLRVCEACMNPRVRAEDGRFEYNTVLSMPEIARLDNELRGNGAPAKAAVWMEETPGGLSVRIIRIDNGGVLYAGNFDGAQAERTRTANIYNATLELGRRLRGESLTHLMIDVGMLPGQHFGFEVAEQFGPQNLNLVGLNITFVDPIAGIGVTYYRVIPLLWDLTIGVQGVLSLPVALGTILEQALDADIDLSFWPDRIVTGVLVARFPIPSTNFAILGTASTNLSFTVGLSLINVSFLPFLP